MRKYLCLWNIGYFDIYVAMIWLWMSLFLLLDGLLELFTVYSLQFGGPWWREGCHGPQGRGSAEPTRFFLRSNSIYLLISSYPGFLIWFLQIVFFYSVNEGHFRMKYTDINPLGANFWVKIGIASSKMSLWSGTSWRWRKVEKSCFSKEGHIF